jgi:hypothetical protein
MRATSAVNPQVNEFAIFFMLPRSRARHDLALRPAFLTIIGFAQRKSR